VEVDFAGDSSGFSTCRYTRWYDQKYGRVRLKADWVKVHLMVGVKTNVVTAAVIGDKDANDCPMLPPLVNATAKNFTVRECSADNGFCSRENAEAVAAVGGTPFIPYKKNVGPDGGGMWEKMYRRFQYRREEFLNHYHKRSNVESTFSAIKRKTGDEVRSKTDTAMKNEVLGKLVAYNFCCVIQEMHELGIKADFWPDKPRDGGQGDDTPVILPMVRPG
jgi:transposase